MVRKVKKQKQIFRQRQKPQRGFWLALRPKIPASPGTVLFGLRACLKIIFAFLFSSVIFTSCVQPLYKNTFVIAGSYLEVTSPDAKAATIVYEEFKRLSDFFNNYDPDSEISRLNKTYPTPFKASQDLIAVLKLSKEIYDLTGGVFDVSQGALYNFWKQYINCREQAYLFPTQEEIGRLRELGGMDNIAIDFIQKTVTIKKQGLKIDLGGIAVGYIVDKAVAKLKEKGIESALIDAGGDIYCLGKNQGKPWKVGIRDPKKRGVFIKVEELSDQAITTSGNYEQFFDYQGKRYSHLVDPRSGSAVSAGIDSVTVISETCALADGLATAFFILGKTEADKILAKNSIAARIFVVAGNE